VSTPAQVWSYRTLITNLAQRDLKARYKRSFLGWLWSLINPATTLGIYTVVFGVFLGATAPIAGNGELQNFALYLFCGLVVWNFFSGTVNISIQSFASAGPLLTRTYFPPECPMLAGLATVALQALIELGILISIMAVLGNLSWTVIVVLPIFVLLGCVSFGVGLVLGLANIRYRDVNYLVGIGLQVLFYATPIVYNLEQVPESFARVIRLNPLTSYVYSIRQGVYALELPTASNWLVMGGTAVVSLVVGWWIFGRYAPRVIEEL
jgi:ABC-2 type transport system permease protein